MGCGEAGHHRNLGFAIDHEIERGYVVRNGYTAVVGIDGGQLAALFIIGGNTATTGGKQQYQEERK